jgi:hypothetical protein
MAEEKKDEKKIIIDEDWKQQAEKEKEKLVAEEMAEKQKAGEHRRGPLPKGDLAGLVSMLFTQTLFSLGLIQAKGEEKRPPDLVLAKYNIDLLEMLEEKTKGNLNEEERKLLANTLDELRMAYVKVTDMIEKQQKG